MPVYLTEAQAKSMLIQKGYYDASLNPTGQGLAHEYVIYDHHTELMWQQSGSSRLKNWTQAHQYITELQTNKFAGFDDWRMPTLDEAMSLMEPVENNHALHINEIFTQLQSEIWTADEFNAGAAWGALFHEGKTEIKSRSVVSPQYLFVRAVRSAIIVQK